MINFQLTGDILVVLVLIYTIFCLKRLYSALAITRQDMNALPSAMEQFNFSIKSAETFFKTFNDNLDSSPISLANMEDKTPFLTQKLKAPAKNKELPKQWVATPADKMPFRSSRNKSKAEQDLIKAMSIS